MATRRTNQPLAKCYNLLLQSNVYVKNEGIELHRIEKADHLSMELVSMIPVDSIPNRYEKMYEQRK